MSYRSRLYQHRNAQTPETEKKKPFFSRKPVAGEEKKKFFRAGGASKVSEEKPEPGGTHPAVIQRLATSQEDEKFGTNEERMARNKEDKARIPAPIAGGAQALTQLPGDKQTPLQRDPAQPDTAEPALTPKQIHDALLYNNDRYGVASVKLIQTAVGAPSTGIMDELTIQRIAIYQAKNGLTPDGMAGPITFDQLTTDATAAGASPEDCLTLFRVGVTTPMEIHSAGVDLVNLFGNFDIEIRFDPHCDCSRFEYRQFIGGDVTLNGVNINNQFSVPGGGLPGLGHFVEDGNTTLAGNGRFGHRNGPANQQAQNQYTDADGSLNMASGCLFNSFDQPGVTGAPGHSGDTYVFDIRFFGDIRKDGKMVERKFWAVRENIIIP